MARRNDRLRTGQDTLDMCARCRMMCTDSAYPRVVGTVKKCGAASRWNVRTTAVRKAAGLQFTRTLRIMRLFAPRPDINRGPLRMRHGESSMDEKIDSLLKESRVVRPTPATVE